MGGWAGGWEEGAMCFVYKPIIPCVVGRLCRAIHNNILIIG